MSFFKLLLGVLLLAIVAANDDQPLWSSEFELTPDVVTRNTETDDTVYRLPENVFPIEYDIYIDLYFEERTEKPFSFEGREYIIIQAREENVTEVVLHANVESINDISLTTTDTNVPVRLNNSEPITLEPQYHFLKINLGQALVVGTNYTLYLDYSNSMNEGPMKRGIWRGWYRDADGLEKTYATTHFQPYNARQAFPCWDEPLFKSVFKLHLSKPSSYLGTFSNTGSRTVSFLDSARHLEEFYPTPRMSSYLVTFLVSESFTVIAEDTSFTPPIRIIGRSNTVNLGDHALKLAVGLTKHFDEYFQIPYSTLDPNLLNDHVSSPDWASAGTENWGMVSYRELNLIIDPHETIMSVEHYSTTLVSHELAHKWFGNLITCFWWSNTWINEGFASYFGYISGHAAFPEYELDEHFNNRYLQASLAFDSGVGTVPMNHDVNTPAQVTGHFGTISYSKGAAFLRMTADIITDDTFRKACQYFLTDNEFEPTDQYDLYNAFQKAIDEDNNITFDFDFEEYYRIWVNEPGYPLLEVEVDHTTGNIRLKQERYFLSASAASTGQIYPIPITYSTSSNRNFDNIRPSFILENETASLTNIAANEWVIFNNQQRGHYRVNYDQRTWELISVALLETPTPIPFLNRAQIVDDVFAFMRSGHLTHSAGFEILRFLKTESNFHVWTAAISGYTWLRNRLRHLPESQAQFDAHILSQMEHVIEELGFDVAEDETPTESMARQSVLHFACSLGHRSCTQESLNRFNAMKAGEWINPRVRRNVYVTAMREGDRSDFVFLLRRFRQSNIANDQLEMLRGLGAVRDPELLLDYLDITLTKEVRSHDKVNAFNYALLGNQENAITVLQFVKNKIDQIRAFPEYELDEHFNNRYLQASLAFDSGVGTVPMNHDVNTPAQVTGHFGTISYSKGAAFLRMTADIITDDTFRKACQYFLTDNEFEPTDQYDLYNAFQKAIDEDNNITFDFDFEEYYRIWVNEPGYPLLEVEVDHTTGNIRLKQERYFLSASAASTGQIYPIPITYSTSSNRNFDNIRPSFILENETASLTNIAANEWVIFNNQQRGHYRVNYDQRTWELISVALLETPTPIPFLNRAQIVDDVFAFMRSGHLTHSAGFEILRFLKTESNFHVWTAAISGYTWLRNRLRHLPESQAQFDAHILSQMEHVIEELGFDVAEDETPTESMARQSVLHFACSLGHRSCTQESLNRFNAMKAGEWINPRVRRNVYVTAMREGDRSDFVFLLRRFRQSNIANDQLEMLRGLGAVRDPELLLDYLDITLTKEVRSHDKVNAFNYALLGNQENAITVLQFVKNKIDQIRVAYVEDAPPNPVHTALSNLATYLDEPGLVEYEDWLRTQTSLPQYNTVINAIAAARNNMAWGTANAETIVSAVRDGASTVVTSMALTVAMVVVAFTA